MGDELPLSDVDEVKDVDSDLDNVDEGDAPNESDAVRDTGL